MYRFRLANPKGLRSRANQAPSVHVHTYQWAHPGERTAGIGANWMDAQSWLKQDLDGVGERLRDNPQAPYVLSILAGHIYNLLDRAALGELRSKEVTCCKSKPGVAEMRLPEPYRIGDIKLLARVYYGEPPEWEGLVSLCLGVKEDSPQWKEQQNASIAQAQDRGETWLENLLH